MKRPPLMSIGRSFHVPEQGTWECDTTFYKDVGENDGYTCVVVFVARLTKLAWLAPQRQKTAKETAGSLVRFIKWAKKLKQPVKHFIHDDGGEMKGEFAVLCEKKYKIK